MTADAEPPRRHAKHWGWFAAILATLGVLGFAASFFLMLPLAMATDGCFESSTDAVCTMSVAGQNTLVFIPWMCLIAGTVAAVAGAVIAARLRRSPLIGIPVGIVGYLAMIPIGWVIAQQA
jgi:TRAP-type transport system small permease protein